MRSFVTIYQAAPGLLNAIIDTFEPDRDGELTRLLKEIADFTMRPWRQDPTRNSFRYLHDESLLLLAVEIEYSEARE